MRHKTIVLELLQDQFPTLHRRLKAERMLLTAVERHALAFKASHEHWKNQLRRTRPGSHPDQVASEALEHAIRDLQDALRAESPTHEGTA
ncbi:MAG: hypothetical protein AB7I30_03375 [Isosphaeraceae bacterium]